MDIYIQTHSLYFSYMWGSLRLAPISRLKHPCGILLLGCKRNLLSTLPAARRRRGISEAENANFALIPNTHTNTNGGSALTGQSCSVPDDCRLQSYWRSNVSLSCPDYPIHHLKAMQVLTRKPWTDIMKICFVFKFFVFTFMKATMMAVESLGVRPSRLVTQMTWNYSCFMW